MTTPTTQNNSINQNNTNEQNTIIFIDGEENKLTIEPKLDEAGPLMKKQYLKAHDIYKKIFGLDEKYKDINPSNDSNSGNEDIVRGNNINNIISFCGDRGTGKTSCLESFRSQIHKLDDHVLILDTIDPSFFDDNHNILQLILGQIYKSIQKHHEKAEAHNYLEFNYSERVLVELNKAISYLKYLAKPEDTPNHYDGMEELEYLAAGIHLQDCISKVIEEYLRFYNKKRLIISIDDIDLNTTGAYIMAEHIRKYLNIKNCVVLLSVNVDQLTDIIKIQMESNKAMKSESYNMAVKYITKFMPLGNRIYMPNLENYCNLRLIYKLNNKQLDFHSVKEAVTLLIFWKTGYLFYNSKGSSSLIVPRSLRQLRQLLHLLAPLRDLYFHEDKDGDKVLKKIPLADLRENQLIFKNYFFGTWPKLFDGSYRRRIKKIIQNTHLLTINKTIISILVNIGNIKELDEFKNISNSAAFAYNISLGDVMRIVEFLSRDESDNQLQNFLFFVRSYYSMLLYEAYDNKIFSLSNSDTTKDGPDKMKGEIYATDPLFNSINELQQIVNGQYFSYSPTDYLAPHERNENEDEDNDDNKTLNSSSNNKLNSRDKRIINGGALFKELNRIIRKDLNGMDLDEIDKFHFNVLEFFILSVSRGVRMKNPNSRWSKDRESSLPIHLSLYGTQSHLVFDVLAPFFNILNLKTTYNRFEIRNLKNLKYDDSEKSISLYEYAYNRDWTLLYSLLKRNGNKEDDVENEHEFLKDSIIRNAEILTAFGEMIKALRSKPRVKKDYLHIADFYKDISNSGMMVYPNKEDCSVGTLSFQFLLEFIRILTKCDDSQYDYLDDSDEKKRSLNYFNYIFNTPLINQSDEITPEGIFTKDKYKHSRIIFLLKEYFHDIYKMKKMKEWETIFPKNNDIPRAKIIDTIYDLMKTR